MRSVGVKVLKSKLSEYLRLAAAGETVLVTDGDRVVAELGPPRPGRAETVADALPADVVAKGWISPPILRTTDPVPRAPVDSFERLMQELDEDRSDR